MKSYREYKKVEVPWLREVPKNWKETKIAAITKLISEKGRPDLPLLSVYRDFGVVQRTESDENHNRIPDDLTGYKVVKPGQLVLNKMKCWQGSLGVSEFEGIVSPAYIVCALNGGHNSHFIQLLLRCRDYVFVWKQISYGVRSDQWDMRYSDFKQVPLFLPSRAEQDAIVAFLQSKEREIEAFIANKRMMIDLLKEQKTTLINHVITRGLDPDVPLKSSGISWLGKIPAHWEVKRIKILGKIRYGLGQPPKEKIGGIPMIRATDIDAGSILDEQIVCVDPDDLPLERNPYLKEGEILIVRSGALTADSAIVPEKYAGAVAGYDMVLNVRKANPSFVAYSLLSDYVLTAQLNLLKTRAAQPHLNAEELGSAVLALPKTHEEQNIIVDFLDSQNKKITNAITDAEHEIDLMKEYRTALIAAAVTGKIDVQQETVAITTAHAPNRHIARAVLSAEIVHQLHLEPTFGRVKHQKILHLCEYVAQFDEIQGEYHRDAAGPFDNRLVYSVEAELKKQKWFEAYEREKFGHGYRPLSKTGGHRKYFERWWADKQPIIDKLIKLMRIWKTLDCEIFSTVYAAWNDLIVWGRQATDDAIVHEVLERWHESKKQVSEERWRKAIAWMRRDGFAPTGFGKATRVAK